jgi:hypothetical protein
MTKFGVEIECLIDGNTAAREICNIEGIRGSARYHGYHSNRDFSLWRVERDGSVEASGGCEVVSPILDTENDGFDQIKKVCRTLTANGARVNVACGLHVHIAVPGLTVDWLKNILQRYADNTSAIDAFMPRSRRSDARQAREYCAPMGNVVTSNFFSQATQLHSLLSCCSRMYAVNVTNYSRLGTIEFRQHGGTLNAEKIRNWVTFLVSFIEASKPATANNTSSTRGRHTGSRGSTHGQIRGAKRRTLVNMLTGDNLNTWVGTQRITTVTGFTLGSLRSTITHLRNQGYRFQYSRNSGMYRCIGIPASLYGVAEPTQDSQQSAAPAQLAELWATVPTEVQSYYAERINDLS